MAVGAGGNAGRGVSEGRAEAGPHWTGERTEVRQAFRGDLG